MIEYRAVGRADFSAFDESGMVKTVYAFKLSPAPNGTLVTAVMRTATTDDHARKWCRRPWTNSVGSVAHTLVGAALESAQAAPEAVPATSSACA
ncbi:MAG: hypothetical protein HYX29_06895 [Solirubrobacterales bacterium]|nr:hypothetical protein [Solirubrobacterales bacterium]